MDLAGSAYLFTMAALGMTFTTMAAVVVVIRQLSGVRLTLVQTYAVEVYVERGFVIAGLSMLPMLVRLFSDSPEIVWRICSAAFFAFFLAYWSIVPGRRRRTANAPAPGIIRMFWVGEWIFTVVLLANAVGYPALPSAGPYAAALTFFLVHTCSIFLMRLQDFLDKPDPLAAKRDV